MFKSEIVPYRHKMSTKIIKKTKKTVGYISNYIINWFSEICIAYG